MTTPADQGDERVRTSFDTADELILPGGKVDPEAIRRAVEAAQRESGDGAALPAVLFTLQRDLNSRLDRYLTSRITFLSRNQLQRLISDGGVTVNGRAAKASTKLRLGDEIEVTVPPPPSRATVPEEIPLSVLHEDEHLIVLNKQPGIIVHPARSELSGTMINALAWHFQNVSAGELSTVGDEFARPGVVHRLDRDTSGCIVFAKDDETHWKLGRQFEKRRVDKRYIAVVQGRVRPDFDPIDLPIGPHPSKEKGYREKQVVRHDDLGKPSVTICRVRERYRLHERPVGDQDFTLCELELKTGRTHQIRVHLSAKDHALVGDDMYGGRLFSAVGASGPVMARQALHAALLAFEHPMTGEDLVFVAPPEGDLLGLIEHLRERGGPERTEIGGTVPFKRLGLEPGLGA
ncbi:MAG: RluA family pseudouridine synthase [Planctomycetota bacterium]